jgi:dGTPase
VARELDLHEDLAETLALVHDLGHTPFGHAGEDALNEVMAPFGGFSHNAQTLRIVTELERRYAAFDGLNLTWETLEGIAKHNGPVDIDQAPEALRRYLARHDLEIGSHAGPEAQVAALADDIAYNNHDIDDGLRAGLFEIDMLADVPLVGPVLGAVRRAHPELERPRLVHEIVRRLINLMIGDLVSETRARILRLHPDNVEAVRALGQPLVAFSPAMAANDRALKRFLFDNMYRHFRVNRMASKARRVVVELFSLLLNEPQCLPNEWRSRAGAPGAPETARLVCDYVAGMTDRYALTEHQRLFDPATQS